MEGGKAKTGGNNEEHTRARDGPEKRSRQTDRRLRGLPSIDGFEDYRFFPDPFIYPALSCPPFNPLSNSV